MIDVSSHPSFRFAEPEWLYLLPFIIIPWLLWKHFQKARQREIAIFVGNQEAKRVSKRVWHKSSALLQVFSFLSIVLGLAGPEINPHSHPLSVNGRDVLFLLDISRSMLAEDMKPNRLERAKLAIRESVDNNEFQRIGLVVYAGSSVVKCPLTTDYDFFKSVLKKVSIHDVPIGGTRISDAIKKVCDKVYDQEVNSFRDLILITDGEDHAAELSVSTLLDEKKVNLIVLGVGDKEQGSRIPEAGSLKTYLTHEGAEVWTRLNEDALRDLAKSCEKGIYISVGRKNYDLYEIYVQATKNMEKGVVGTDSVVIYDSISHFFAALSAIVFCIAYVDKNGSQAFVALFVCCLLIPSISCSDPKSKRDHADLNEMRALYETTQNFSEETSEYEMIETWGKLAEQLKETEQIAVARYNIACANFKIGTSMYLEYEGMIDGVGDLDFDFDEMEMYDIEMIEAHFKAVANSFQSLIAYPIVSESAGFNYEMILKLIEWLNLEEDLEDPEQENQNQQQEENQDQSEAEQESEGQDSEEGESDSEMGQDAENSEMSEEEIESGRYNADGSGLPKPTDNPSNILEQFKMQESERSGNQKSGRVQKVEKDW